MTSSAAVSTGGLQPVIDYAAQLRDAETSLSEVEARYNALTELSSEWYWEHDAEQRFTRISERVHDRTGIAPNAILGKTRWETDIGYDPAERAALEAVMAARRPFYDFQFTRASLEGGLRHISVSGEPMIDRHGVYHGYRGIGKDITERKRAQSALEESQRFSRATLDALSDHMCVLDASGTIVTVNRSWCRFLDANRGGLTGELIGANYLAACDNASADARDDGLAAAAGIRAVLSGEHENFRHEYRCDGPEESGWFALKATRFPGAGAVRVVIAHENISERMAAEARVERINTLFQALGETNDAVIRIRDRTELMHVVTTITASLGRFLAVKVWMKEPGSTFVNAILTKGKAGDDLGSTLERVDLATWVSDGPTGPALIEDRPVVRNDVDRRRSPHGQWTGALEYVRSSAAFPLREDGRVIGALSIYSSEVGYFNSTLVELLERIAAGLSLGLADLAHDAKRKASESALRVSEARFRNLTELSADWYWEQNETLRFRSLCNGREIEAGLTPDADLGKARWELSGIGDADWQGHRETLAARKGFRDFEFKRTFPDGSIRDTCISGEPIFDGSGRFAGYRGVGRDVTEPRREARILALEHRVARCLSEGGETQTAIETVICAVCEIEKWSCGIYLTADEKAGVLRASQSWSVPGGKAQRFVEQVRDLQVPRNAGVCGEVWQSGKPIWIADARDDARLWRRDLIIEGAARGTFGFPCTLGRKTVGVFMFFSDEIREPNERLLSAVSLIGGQAGEFLQHRRAEESLRQSEARYRALTALSSDWYWEHDEHQRFTRMSSGADKMGGMVSSAIIGKTRWESMTGYDPKRRADFEAIVDSRQPFRDFEFSRIGPDGVPRVVQTSGEPMYDGTGRYVGYRGIGRDVSERRRVEEQLRFQALLLGMVGEAVIATDTAGRITYWNDYAERLYGWTAAEVLGADVFEITRANESKGDGGEAMRQTALAHVWRGETLAKRRNGETFPAHLTLAPILNAGGVLTGLIGVSRDISELKHTEKVIRDNARQQGVIAAFGQHALASADLDDLLEQAAVAVGEGLDVGFSAVLQIAPDGQSLLAKAGMGWDDRWRKRRFVDAGPHTWNHRVLDSGETVVVDDFQTENRFTIDACVALHALRSNVTVVIGGAGGAFGVLSAYSRDVGRFQSGCVHFLRSIANTLATAIDRRAAEDRVTYLAQFDSLTGLPNRGLLRDRLANAMAQAVRHQWGVGVMFIDLDGFKEVNDTFGHAVGDQLLVAVARRLQDCIREGDTVGRLGGDEFAIVLANMATADRANAVAQRVLEALAGPIDVEGQEVRVTASLGISVHPGDGDTPELLLKNADAAMYRAKGQGRNSWQFFTKELNARIANLIRCEQEAARRLSGAEVTPSERAAA